jgi:ribosome-binding protein aMBF1 (putative translation factor)
VFILEDSCEVSCYDPETKQWESIFYEDIKIFGMKLTQLRESKKLSIEQLSHRIGWDSLCIEAWEKGDPVSGKMIKQLSHFYGVSVDWLLSKSMPMYEQLTLF